MRSTNALILKAMARVQSMKSDEGATAVEYGIMVALIAAVIIAAVVLIGTDLKAAFEAVEKKLPATYP